MDSGNLSKSRYCTTVNLHISASLILPPNMGNLPLDSISRASKELYPLITAEVSSQILKKYNDNQWTLAELDEWRTVTLPNKVKQRHEKHKVHLTKDELTLLMDWKLAKGKFRPMLPKLIKSNLAEEVESISKDGLADFMKFAQGKSWKDTDIQEYQAVVKYSLKIVCQLKGVGPATGSLILSLLSATTPLAPPFFSDELFIYYIQEPLRPGSPIKYNVKEYVDEYVGTLFNIVSETKDFTMDQLEKGGWALKMYEMQGITKLANVELPFDVDRGLLNAFPDTAKYQPKVEKKRKAEPKKPQKRVKKE